MMASRPLPWHMATNPLNAPALESSSRTSSSRRWRLASRLASGLSSTTLPVEVGVAAALASQMSALREVHDRWIDDAANESALPKPATKCAELSALDQVHRQRQADASLSQHVPPDRA